MPATINGPIARMMINEIRERGPANAVELSNRVGCSPTSIRSMGVQLADVGVISSATVLDEAGYRAKVYRLTGAPIPGCLKVDIGVRDSIPMTEHPMTFWGVNRPTSRQNLSHDTSAATPISR